MNDNTNDEFVQHDIEGAPLNDTQKGMELEALASGAAGSLAGSPLGAMGAVAGAMLGSSVGSVVSGEPMQPIDFEGDWDKYSANGQGTTSQEDSTETSSG